jgi:chromosome segregation ATPase
MASKDKKKYRKKIKLDNLEKLIVTLTSKIDKQNNMIGILAKYLKDEKSKLNEFENELEKCKAEINAAKLGKTLIEENSPSDNQDVIMIVSDRPNEETNIVVENDDETVNSSSGDDIYGWMKCDHVSQFENLFEECKNL